MFGFQVWIPVFALRKYGRISSFIRGSGVKRMGLTPWSKTTRIRIILYKYASIIYYLYINMRLQSEFYIFLLLQTYRR